MYKELFKEIGRRFLSPWNHPPFLFYYILSIIVLGAIGIAGSVVEVFNNKDMHLYYISSTIGTYFITIMAVSFADLNMDNEIRYSKAMLLLSFLVLIITLGLLYLSYSLKNNYSFIPAIFGVILSHTVWVIANSNDDKYKEKSYDRKVREEANLKHGVKW